MLYGSNGLESSQKILMCFNSFFWGGGGGVGPKSSWAKRGPMGQVWAPQKKYD